MTLFSALALPDTFHMSMSAWHRSLDINQQCQAHLTFSANSLHFNTVPCIMGTYRAGGDHAIHGEQNRISDSRSSCNPLGRILDSCSQMAAKQGIAGLQIWARLEGKAGRLGEVYREQAQPIGAIPQKCTSPPDLWREWRALNKAQETLSSVLRSLCVQLDTPILPD